MEVGTDYSSESKRRFVKQQLLNFGYEGEFSDEVLPLLQNLITDVIQATENLNHYKELSHSCLEACQDLETFLDAYKNDNAWLVQELNTLHLNALSEKIELETRISELESSLKNFSNGRVGHVKCVSRPVQRTGEKPPSRSEALNLKEVVNKKDSEIKHLQAEINRLNNLLSGGRPLEAILKDSYCNFKCNNWKTQLNNSILSEHEAKRNALRLADLIDLHDGDDVNYINDAYRVSGNKVANEKLKSIEQELENLKTKYQKLEADTKNIHKLSTKQSEENKSEAISSIKEKCKMLETEKIRFLNEIDLLKKSSEATKCACSKAEKELLEVKRSCQELSVEKADRDKCMKKTLEEKKHLLNRLHELSIIERDLTLEVTRLCNVNAIHKRHILELENKLIDVSINKGVAVLSSLKPDIIKKPLERRIPNIKKKENAPYTKAAVSESDKVSKEVSKLREKYEELMKSSRVDFMSLPFSSNEFQTNPNFDGKGITFIDEIKLLSGKVDNLRTVLIEKEKTLAGLVSENRKLTDAVNEIDSTKHPHSCDQCTLSEKMIGAYKEKLIALEAEKRNLLQQHSKCPQILECNRHHIMQLRDELHSAQLQLHQYKTDSGRLSQLEKETYSTVESSRAVQQQLELQLESSQKKIKLLETDYASLRSELLTMRDVKLKLQKSVIDLEAEKSELSNSLEEKCKKVNSLEKLIKSKDVKITKLQQLSDELQQQMRVDGGSSSTSSVSCIEQLRTQIRNLEKNKDYYVSETRRLERQLVELNKNYAACQKDLKKAKSEAEILKNQMHEYIAQVKNAEETLQEKTKERCEMLDHFRNMTAEASKLESNNHTLESEARITRAELKNAESKIEDLNNIIRNKNDLITAFEEQLNDLTVTVASLEGKMSNLTDQRDRLQAELESCEMCSKFHTRQSPSPTDIANRKLRKEITSLEFGNRQLQNRAHSYTSEIIRPQSSSQNFTVVELQEEIRGLKANIKCLEENLDVTSRKLRKTLNDSADYQRQINQLNSKLKSLQFLCVQNSSNPSINNTSV